MSASNQSLKTTFNRADVSEDTDKAELLKTLYKNIDVERISNSLDELTSFYNRAAYSDTGYQAAGHIRTWMDLLASKNELTDSQFSVSFLPTNTFYRQPSVVAVLGKDLPGNALVISAHLDTNGGGRRPGADDDGSGSMVVLEAARLIANSGHEFNRPIYFIWYAAEEVGLVGSKRVVQDMKNRGVKVDSVLHFDTVGRRAVEDDPTLWLLKDYVDPNFTDYISGLIKKHIQVPVQYTTCGYACSDHASWTNGGFSSAAAFESSFDDINPYLHTANDTRDHVSLENLVNFTKLALAYAVDKSA